MDPGFRRDDGVVVIDRAVYRNTVARHPGENRDPVLLVRLTVFSFQMAEKRSAIEPAAGGAANNFFCGKAMTHYVNIFP